MKNYEKYAEEMRGYKGDNFCGDFILPNILKSDYCADMFCGKCYMLQMLWLLEDCEEPKEPETDWSKVEVDTPILVREFVNGEWQKRHFAKYEGGVVYTWSGGYTSWTTTYADTMMAWKYAKLAESEEEPKIDWSKVKVDTPILVRDNENSKWLERYFAKYEDGLVYAWLGENTSYTTCSAAKWKYVKLAEGEE